MSSSRPIVFVYPDKERQFGFSFREDMTNPKYPTFSQMFTHPHMGRYVPIRKPYNGYNYAWVK